jgi:hypothetical protein
VSEEHQQIGPALQPGKGHPIIAGVVSGLIVAVLAPALLGWWHKDGMSALHSLVSFLSGAFTFFAVLFFIWLILSPSKKGSPVKEGAGQKPRQDS